MTAKENGDRTMATLYRISTTINTNRISKTAFDNTRNLKYILTKSFSISHPDSIKQLATVEQLDAGVRALLARWESALRACKAEVLKAVVSQ